MERHLWHLYTGHEIEDTLDIDNRNSFRITTNKNLIINYSYYFMFKIRACKLEFRTSLKFKLKVFVQKIKLFTFSWVHRLYTCAGPLFKTTWDCILSKFKCVYISLQFTSYNEHSYTWVCIYIVQNRMS